jgi:hypothetical protein
VDGVLGVDKRGHLAFLLGWVKDTMARDGRNFCASCAKISASINNFSREHSGTTTSSALLPYFVNTCIAGAHFSLIWILPSLPLQCSPERPSARCAPVPPL